MQDKFNRSKISSPGTIRLRDNIWPMLRRLIAQSGRGWLEDAIYKKDARENPEFHQKESK